MVILGMVMVFPNSLVVTQKRQNSEDNYKTIEGTGILPKIDTSNCFQNTTTAHSNGRELR